MTGSPVHNGSIAIAIDGPAGSGKSTVSKRIAEKLGLLYIDTGAMYRALTLKAMRLKVDLESADQLARLVHGTSIDLEERAGRLAVIMDGEDVSGFIRTPELTNNVKFIARVPAVREEMVRLQRLIGTRRSAVLEGRDIGTVVFPDTPYKFYLDASVETRAVRRYSELAAAGHPADLETIRRDIIVRDESDFKRSVGALKRADGAHYIDTSTMTIDEVVVRVLELIRQ